MMHVVLPPSSEDLEVIRRLARIDVVVKKDLPEHPELPWRLKRGMEASIPVWLFEALEKEGFVERKEPMDVRIVEIMLHKEQMTTRPLKMPEDTYSWLKKEIERAYERKDADPLEIRRLISNLFDLSSARLRKIVRYLLLSHVDNMEWRILEHLTPEERVLYLVLREIIDKWRMDLREEK
jgi:hypothetical protein